MRQARRSLRAHPRALAHRLEPHLVRLPLLPPQNAPRGLARLLRPQLRSPSPSSLSSSVSPPPFPSCASRSRYSYPQKVSGHGITKPGGPAGASPPAFGTRRRAVRAVRRRVLPPPLPLLWPMTTPTTTSRPTTSHGHPSRAESLHRWAHATVYGTVARPRPGRRLRPGPPRRRRRPRRPRDPAAARRSLSITSHALRRAHVKHRGTSTRRTQATSSHVTHVLHVAQGRGATSPKPRHEAAQPINPRR